MTNSTAFNDRVFINPNILKKLNLKRPTFFDNAKFWSEEDFDRLRFKGMAIEVAPIDTSILTWEDLHNAANNHISTYYCNNATFRVKSTFTEKLPLYDIFHSIASSYLTELK